MASRRCIVRAGTQNLLVYAIESILLGPDVLDIRRISQRYGQVGIPNYPNIGQLARTTATRGLKLDRQDCTLFGHAASVG